MKEAAALLRLSLSCAGGGGGGEGGLWEGEGEGGRRGRLDSKTITTIPKKKKKSVLQLARSLLLAYRLRNPGARRGGRTRQDRAEFRASAQVEGEVRVPALGCGGPDRHRLRLCLFHPAQPKPQPFIFYFFVSSFSSPPRPRLLPQPPSSRPGPAYCSHCPFSGGSCPALPPARRRHSAAAPSIQRPRPPLRRTALPAARAAAHGGSPPGRLSSCSAPPCAWARRLLSLQAEALPEPAGRPSEGLSRGGGVGSQCPLVGYPAPMPSRRGHRFSGERKRAPLVARERG